MVWWWRRRRKESGEEEPAPDSCRQPPPLPRSDLALRNCLLTSDLTVRIGDYGLAHSNYKVGSACACVCARGPVCVTH